MAHGNTSFVRVPHTAAVSLLEVPTPASGQGTGISILLEDEKNHGASLQRVVMPGGDHVYISHNDTPERCRSEVTFRMSLLPRWMLV